MPNRYLNVQISNVGGRNDVRRRIVETFLQESPGTGTGDLASKYEYCVATLADNRQVVLTRPANLKNGFDFLIRVPGFNFNPSGRQRDYPKHEELITDLETKKDLEPEKYLVLRSYIEQVFQCSSEVESFDLNRVNFSLGFSSELILHITKWFFIEQDIRYWNYSGRNMLATGIPV